VKIIPSSPVRLSAHPVGMNRGMRLAGPDYSAATRELVIVLFLAKQSCEPVPTRPAASTRKSIALPFSTFTAFRLEAKVTSPSGSVRPIGGCQVAKSVCAAGVH